MEAVIQAIRSISLALNPAPAPAAAIQTTTAQSMATGGSRVVTTNTVTYDNSAMTTTAGRITISKAGVYVISGQISFGTVSGTGERQVNLFKNGAVMNGGIDWKRADASYFIYTAISIQAYLSAGDYIQLGELQDSGGNLNVTGFLEVAWVSQ